MKNCRKEYKGTTTWARYNLNNVEMSVEAQFYQYSFKLILNKFILNALNKNHLQSKTLAVLYKPILLPSNTTCYVTKRNGA